MHVPLKCDQTAAHTLLSESPSWIEAPRHTFLRLGQLPALSGPLSGGRWRLTQLGADSLVLQQSDSKHECTLGGLPARRRERVQLLLNHRDRV